MTEYDALRAGEELRAEADRLAAFVRTESRGLPRPLRGHLIQSVVALRDEADRRRAVAIRAAVRNTGKGWS